jgi:4-amino-4-deoxy-L-arabinose transferase-like glycosyltransferase
VTAIAALSLYGVYLYRHTCFAVGGSDSSGYANAARGFAQGELVVPIEGLSRFDLPASFGSIFTPLGYVLLPGHRTTAPMYPIGFPLHLALAGTLFGWEKAPYLVSPLAAIFCLIIMYAAGRELGLSRWAAVGGALLLASCPTFVFQAVQPMSDVTATFWTLVAVLAALKAREDRRWAAVAGFALGIAVLVRPLDVLLLLPLTLALPLGRRGLALFLLGGVLPAAFLFAYNNACFGSPFESGYSMTGHWGRFRLAYFPSHFSNYVRWTSSVLTPLVCLGWLALPFARRTPGRDRAFLFTWFASFLLAYSFYQPADQWWYTRFLLPGMPAIILAFLLVVRDLALASSGFVRQGMAVAAVIAVALATALGFRNAKSWSALDIWRGQAAFPRACLLAAERLPVGALVVSSDLSGALRYYTKLQPVRWDVLTGDSFGELRERAAVKGAHLFALLRNYEILMAKPHLPGNWTHLADLEDVSLWALED